MYEYDFFDILARIILGSGKDSILLIILNILAIIGYWGILQKCGVKGWWALVPVARDIKLGEAAARKREGLVIGILHAVQLLLVFIMPLLVDPSIPPEEQPVALTDILELLVFLIWFIYSIRLYLGLIELFGKKKRWLILWIFAEFIPACLWGWCKKDKPLWTVEEVRSAAANYFSNARVTVLENGLTVNLEERTIRELFKKKYLLRDIHLTIQPGHMVLLLGGSGAGKTTFLNAVNGYEKAKAEIMLNGRNMYTNYNEMQHDIGFVPQQDLMRGSDTVFRTLMDAANMRLPADFTKADRQARVETVLEIFGLSSHKNSEVSKLSGGQRKRLSIAMEFISNPTLFIIDEPDSGLDGVMARELFTQPRRIADQGKIIIVITHTPDRVIDMFDDVIVLAKDTGETGRLAFFGSVEESRAFFGKENMEEIVKSVNSKSEGGDGLADDYILKMAEVQHA